MGQDVYHPSVLYLTHGTDDFHGGLCEITDVIEKPSGVFVRLKEYPDWEVSWPYLMEGQDEWRKQYGDQRGRPDPDERPEFNEP